MRHFVQYHNPDKMGEWSPADGFYIVTKRKPACSKDDRVWLIGRRGKPRKYEYVLWMTFPLKGLALITPDGSRTFRTP